MAVNFDGPMSMGRCRCSLSYIDVDVEHEYRKTIESLKSEVKELKMLIESQKLSGEIVNNFVLAITQHIRTEDKKEIEGIKQENESLKKENQDLRYRLHKIFNCPCVNRNLNA